MATIDESAKKVISSKPWIKTALGVLFAILTYGRQKGLFSEENSVKK
jgi:hypothetical protein